MPILVRVHRKMQPRLGSHLAFHASFTPLADYSLNIAFACHETMHRSCSLQSITSHDIAAILLCSSISSTGL